MPPRTAVGTDWTRRGSLNNVLRQLPELGRLPDNRNGHIGCDIDGSDDFGYAGEDEWYEDDDEIGDQYIPSGRGSISR